MRAADLAAAFDRGFVAARAPAGEATDDFLAVHVGGRPHALRLREIAGLHPAQTPTWLPGSAEGLSGIIGLRGTLLPVFDLAFVLGLERAGVCRWMVLAAATPVGFAFESFDGHFRAPVSAVVGAAAEADGPAREAVAAATGRLPVVHLDALLTTIRRRLPPATP
jgi:chemotaxis signal transduction protein